MPIFSNSQTNDVNRMLSQQVCISLTFLFKVFRQAIQIVDFLERNFVKDTNSKEMSKTLWGFRMYTDVFIHMKSVYSGPVDAFVMNQMTQKLIL